MGPGTSSVNAVALAVYLSLGLLSAEY